jgi:hypothetical protein
MNKDYIPKLYIRTEIDEENGEIRQTIDNAMADIQSQIINTKENHTRAALIRLGWTPPKRDKYWFEFWRDA